MAIRHRHVNIEERPDQGPSPFRNQFKRLPNTATSALDAAAAANEGAIVYDETTSTVKFSNGIIWANIGAGASATLDQIFDNGQVIDSCAVAKKLSVTGGGATLTIWDDLTDIQFASDADFVLTATEVKLVAADVLIGTGAAHADLLSRGDFNLVLKTGNSTTGSITITDGANGDLLITPNGSGEVVVGSGAAHAAITSSGAYNLVLDTNSGTNSGSITITDAANGDIDITPNGSGVVELTNGIVASPIKTTAAGTATLAPALDSCIHNISTDVTDPCEVTLPDASTAQGKELVFFFVVDGGQDVVITVGAGDAYYADGDISDTIATMADAGDFLILKAIGGNHWVVVESNGVTFS